MLIALSVITAFFILTAGLIMPLFIGPKFTASNVALTVGLSQVLVPGGAAAGAHGASAWVLQSYDRFTLQALSPAIWNVIIIVLLVMLHPLFHGENAHLRIRDRGTGRHGRAVVVGLGRSARIDFRLADARSTGTTRA